MGLFGRNIEESYGTPEDPRLNELEREVNYLSYELRNAQEDLLRVSDAFDNIGWAPLSEANAKEITLETVKRMAYVSRGLYSMNPFVQSGVNARIGYVWGRGVTFDGVESISDDLDDNRKKLFNNTAYTELERAL